MRPTEHSKATALQAGHELTNVPTWKWYGRGKPQAVAAVARETIIDHELHMALRLVLPTATLKCWCTNTLIVKILSSINMSSTIDKYKIKGYYQTTYENIFIGGSRITLEIIFGKRGHQFEYSYC